MAIKVKSAAASADKFARNVANSRTDYEAGVQGTDNQAEAAIAAQPAYEQGIQDSISRGARVRGLQKSGTSKWKSKALAVGGARLASGATAAKGDYQSNVDPYLQTIAGINLPPRGPKGSPENFTRSQVVGTALRNKKITG